MNCHEWSQLISKKLDGELTTPEEEKLSEHLAACDACREEERVQTGIRDAMRAAATPARHGGCPPKFKRDIWNKVDRPLTAMQLRWFRIGAVAAVLLLSAAVLLLAQRLRTVEKFAERMTAQANQPAGYVGAHVNGSVATANLREHLVAFGNIQDYWRGALRWMAVDGDQAELGISRAAQADSVSPNVIVLTLQYVKHSSDGRQSVLANPQFVLLPGEEASARLASKANDALPCQYRVKAAPEGNDRIRVSLSFTGRAGATDFSFTTNTLAADGASDPILAGATGDHDNRWALYLWAAERHAQTPKETGRTEGNRS